MVIKQRNIVTSLILSFVTCGIYSIYWIISVAREAVIFRDANDSGLLEIILMLFLPPVGLYLSEQKFAQGCAMRGVPHKDNSLLYLVLGFVGLGIVAICMLQNDLNKVANA